MIFDVVTIFPGFFESILQQGMLRRAIEGECVKINLHDLRDFTDDRHRTVDDRPFGGGPGMVLMPGPVFRAVEAIEENSPGEKPAVILLSPQGRLFRQSVADELARLPRMVLICGRYEGVDERVAEHLATDEISIGDYVLSGGELPAAVLMEAVTRLIPGALGNEESCVQESFGGAGADASGAGGGTLDCAHYTRPADFRGWRVPDILLSGNHGEIRKWRRRRALEKTWRKRPELLSKMKLDAEGRAMLEAIQALELAGRAR